MPDLDGQPEPLPAALLLAATGGMLDAFVYLNHGHVFANAQTGNVVLLGISLLSHSWFEAVRHSVPLCAFLGGVVAARLLRSLLGRRSGIVCLGLEIVGLAITSLLPVSFPQMIYTALIAFLASCQITSFRRVGRYSYNATFMTGNLRTIIEGLYAGIGPAGRHEPPNPAGFDQARALGFISICFLLGVLIGAFLAPRFSNHTLWFVLPLLLAAGAIVAPAALTPEQP